MQIHKSKQTQIIIQAARFSIKAINSSLEMGASVVRIIDGDIVGDIDGDSDRKFGYFDGCCVVGSEVGLLPGNLDGRLLGSNVVGDKLGIAVLVGTFVGFNVGNRVGANVDVSSLKCGDMVG